jgi:hypothetical protein
MRLYDACCSYFSVFVRGQVQKELTQPANRADTPTSAFRHKGPIGRSSSRQRNQAKVSGFAVHFPTTLNAPRYSNGRIAGFLAKLETENAELRHEAVELALQIQKLVESQLR